MWDKSKEGQQLLEILWNLLPQEPEQVWIGSYKKLQSGSIARINDEFYLGKMRYFLL